MVEETFSCPNCGEVPWVKTVAHYMCLKCGNLFLHDWVLDNGYSTIRASIPMEANV